MKVLLADDHELIREGLERTLVALGKETHFVHAMDRASVMAQLEAHRDIDVILLDLFMPGVNGFDLLGEICDQYSHVPVVVLSGAEDPRYMRKAIDSGAAGFIPKSANTDIMMSAIDLVGKGGVYIPPDMFQKKSATAKKPGQMLANELCEAGEKLTARQLEVLELMGLGMSNKDIARALDVSNHTVKVHVAAILKLFDAANRTEAVVMAQNAGVIKS